MPYSAAPICPAESCSAGHCAILYAGVALVLTGIVPGERSTIDAPVANAAESGGLNRLRFIVTVGALLEWISSFWSRPI